MVLKSFLIASSLLLLINCTGQPKEIVVDAKPIEIEIVQPNDPAPVNMQDIEWKIIEVDGFIFYAVTINGYQILAQNMLELKRYIIELQANNNYYKIVTE